jgi:hypothetical protein
MERNADRVGHDGPSACAWTFLSLIDNQDGERLASSEIELAARA